MNFLRLSLAAVIVVGVLVTSTWWGNLSAYAALFGALASAPFVLRRDTFDAAVNSRGIPMFLAAFALIAAAMVISSRGGENLLALGDFVVLLLSLLVFSLFIKIGAKVTIQHLAGAALIGSFVAVGVCLYEVYVLRQARATGYYSSALFMGNVGTLLGYMALAGVWDKTVRLRFLYAVGPMLGAVAAILSGSRGSIISSACVLLALVAYTSFRRPKAILPFLIWGALFASIVCLVIVSAGGASRLVLRFGEALGLLTTGQTDDRSILYRLEFYKAALAAFSESPVVGHGWWEKFTSAAAHMPSDNFRAGFEFVTSHLHNDVLNFSVGMGIIGLVAYLLIALAPLMSVQWSDTSDRGMACASWAITLTVGVLVMGLTDSMFVQEMPKTVYIFASAMLCAQVAKNRRAAAT